MDDREWETHTHVTHDGNFDSVSVPVPVRKPYKLPPQTTARGTGNRIEYLQALTNQARDVAMRELRDRLGLDNETFARYAAEIDDATRRSAERIINGEDLPNMPPSQTYGISPIEALMKQMSQTTSEHTQDE